ncbi:hypothetical protein HOG48_03360 [Candidatus Peregrinibacteria bacterium]|jgi:hypothetical protein|nr:hypothetical protein [Candidatus Peregrinibacteria bacterium]
MTEYIHPISVKELRSKLPFVRKQLAKGQSFMIIYQSIPIAELKPIQKTNYFKEATDKEWEETSLKDIWDDLGEVSAEEYEYYENLIEKNAN